MSQATTMSGATSPRGGSRGALRGNPWLTLISVAIGVMMVALDGTVVAIANPAIQDDLHASLPSLQWITNGYLLSLAVFLVTAGKLGDKFGHKSMFLTGVVGFGVVSLFIGLTPHIDRGSAITVIIALRVLQGVFGAILQPAALGLLRAVFPAEKLNMAIGIWGGAIGTATAAGPIVGGLLVEHINWESVFFINVPVGIIALVIGLLVLGKNRATDPKSALDYPGMALFSASIFCLVFALIKASAWGWGDPKTLGFLAGFLVVGALFILWEQRAKSPLLPMSLFRSMSLSIGTLLMVIMAFAMFGAMFFVTFYLENVHGLSAVMTGVRMLPMTAMLIVGAPLAGAMATRYGPRPVVVLGMAFTTVPLFGLATLSTDAGGGITSLWFVLLGIGLSLVIVGATEAIVGNAPLEMSGTASGLQQSAMQVGGSLGTAVLGAVMSALVGSTLQDKFTHHGLKISDAQVDQAKELVATGGAPVPKGTSGSVAQQIIDASHASFMSGLHTSFVVAGIVAALGTLAACFVRKGKHDEAPPVHTFEADVSDAAVAEAGAAESAGAAE